MRPWNEQDERDLDTIAALICGVVYAVGAL